jgi:hypothetical protein
MPKEWRISLMSSSYTRYTKRRAGWLVVAGRWCERQWSGEEEDGTGREAKCVVDCRGAQARVVIDAECTGLLGAAMGKTAGRTRGAILRREKGEIDAGAWEAMVRVMTD